MNFSPKEDASDIPKWRRAMELDVAKLAEAALSFPLNPCLRLQPSEAHSGPCVACDSLRFSSIRRPRAPSQSFGAARRMTKLHGPWPTSGGHGRSQFGLWHRCQQTFLAKNSDLVWLEAGETLKKSSSTNLSIHYNIRITSILNHNLSYTMVTGR